MFVKTIKLIYAIFCHLFHYILSKFTKRSIQPSQEKEKYEIQNKAFMIFPSSVKELIHTYLKLQEEMESAIKNNDLDHFIKIHMLANKQNIKLDIQGITEAYVHLFANGVRPMDDSVLTHIENTFYADSKQNIIILRDIVLKHESLTDYAIYAFITHSHKCHTIKYAHNYQIDQSKKVLKHIFISIMYKLLKNKQIDYIFGVVKINQFTKIINELSWCIIKNNHHFKYFVEPKLIFIDLLRKSMILQNNKCSNELLLRIKSTFLNE